MLKALLTTALCVFALSSPSFAQDDVLRAELRPGWRLPSGEHMAALHVKLAPGWKTYWRAPGDAGIPPLFDWSGSDNLSAVQTIWPTPGVFWQSDMRSIGYHNELVLPLRLKPSDSAAPITLSAQIELGVCEEICIPKTLLIQAVLPPGVTKPDPTIVAAMADRPYTAQDAKVQQTRCAVTPSDRGMDLEVQITMPPGTGREELVIEAGDPEVWVADPKAQWQGNRLVAKTQMIHIKGGPFSVNRSALRITVLGGHMPIDIRGCSG